jgi:hypothetical protein
MRGRKHIELIRLDKRRGFAPGAVLNCVLVFERGSTDRIRPGSPMATWTRPLFGLKKVASGTLGSGH